MPRPEADSPSPFLVKARTPFVGFAMASCFTPSRVIDALAHVGAKGWGQYYVYSRHGSGEGFGYSSATTNVLGFCCALAFLTGLVVLTTQL